jgi:hypothetical protein
MISCRNIAGLLLSEQIVLEPWWRRMEIRMHLGMCRVCGRFARQLRQIRASTLEMANSQAPGPGLEQRILNRLEKGQD